MRLLTKPLHFVLVGVVLTILIVGGWFYVAGHPFGSAGRPVLVHVSDGESVGQLASELQSKRVISSAFALRLDTSVFGSLNLHPGVYVIRQNSSFGRVRSVFGGPSNVDAVSVVAGETLYETQVNVANATSTAFANQWAIATHRAATTSPFHPHGSLEGLVGVGTYLILPNESPAQLVHAMTSAFLREAARAGITPGTRRHGLDAYQLVTAASIVEKEGYYPQNMGRVARVLLNRLARGGGLQMDSTILYYFNEDGGTVTHAMLQTNTPYNTYLHPGLTPTPICQPSPLALRSMVSPPPGTWLYFTLINENGTMAFSNTFAQQLHWEQVAASKGIG
jgi:uncharacterized YceG family protein